MQLALIRKDLGGITGNRNIMSVMLILPLVFTVFFPTIFILLLHFAPQETGDLQKMLELLPLSEQSGDMMRDTLRLLLNRVMPIFFMLIPIMAASVMAASSFVGEKEKRTLETLIYCPLSLKQIFQAKIFASFALSMLVSFGSFLLMVVVTQVELYLTLGSLIMPDAVWLITMLLLAPALSIIAITIIVRGSAKARTMEESQQRSIFLILPILLLIVGQFTGLMLVNAWILLALGAALAVAAVVLIRLAVRKLDYEALFR